ncbi:hypothetical protein OH768_12240 [Streptomyces sp. NBC_01622]|uniref:hypothetical protein n=1 Tax=Streptomyces sp. NBC_01622 TaxID=2975903 RepID=UPI0038646428|nr:hypothetical protein OH768_12240 [Streptomyces sp. NBC_01622]
MWTWSGTTDRERDSRQAIYVRYEVSDAGREEQPAIGGTDARFDELRSLLAPHRRMPDGARRLVGEVRFDDGDDRYRLDGVDHWFRWRPVG